MGEEIDSDLFLPGIDDHQEFLVIGDPHFRVKFFLEGQEFIEKCINYAREVQPDVIVVLGDIHDTHETMKQSAFKLIETFIEGLSEIAEVYLLMGNHDYINNSQFLSDAHFFGPYKKWPRVTVVDQPIVVTLSDNDERFVVMCPYTPPGKLVEALNTLEPTGVWQDALCVFCHQEIKGVVVNGYTSTSADTWDALYPPIVSGHIHKAQIIGSNVFYPGSSMQIAINEDDEKVLWLMSFDDDGNLDYDEVSLGLKTRREIRLEVGKVKTFDFDLAEQHYVTIRLLGTSQEFAVFRKSAMYTKLRRANVRITFDPIIEVVSVDERFRGRAKTKSFDGVLRELIKTKSEKIKQAYGEVCGNVEVRYKLAFDEG